MTQLALRPFLARAAAVGIVAGLLVVAALRGVPDLDTGAARARGSFARAVAMARPSVVSIATTRTIDQPLGPLLSDPLFRRFLDLPPEPLGEREQAGLGSGVIIDARGYVVTNHHVIAGSDSIRVVLADGSAWPASVIGTDPETDLAVLSIDAAGLVAARIGDSQALQAGDVVLAIGNPLGFAQTVTQGIVSATGRNRVGITTFENFIQTDAAINPGNSGGALVNIRGELVGINSAIASESGGFQGIGLAIPSRFLTDVVDQLLTRGRVVRGWLGVAASSAPGGGVIIGGTLRGGPADRAGIEPGDLLVAIDGKAVADARQALDLISSLQPGTIAVLTIRREGQRQRLEAMVSTRPPSTGR